MWWLEVLLIRAVSLITSQHPSLAADSHYQETLRSGVPLAEGRGGRQSVSRTCVRKSESLSLFKGSEERSVNDRVVMTGGGSPSRDLTVPHLMIITLWSSVNIDLIRPTSRGTSTIMKALVVMETIILRLLSRLKTPLKISIKVKMLKKLSCTGEKSHGGQTANTLTT